jgi:uncharacterized membrane protein YqiK
MNIILLLVITWYAQIAIVAVILLVLLFFGASLLGIVYIQQDKIGIVNKKFSAGKKLEAGAIVALNGEAGIQADTLSPGLHFSLWPWKYSIRKEKLTIVPPGQFCQVVSIAGKPLNPGRNLADVVACNNFQDVRDFIQNGGQKGQQLAVLTAGSYKINTEVFKVEPPTDILEVKTDQVGIVTVREGRAIEDGEMAKFDVGEHDHFQNAQAFIDNGGYKGLQISVLQAGRYIINPWFADVEFVPMTDVPVGHCAVVISYVSGKKEETPIAIQAKDEAHIENVNPNQKSEENTAAQNMAVNAKIVETGQKGVWKDPLGPGKYPINTHVQEVKIIPVTQIALYWADSKTQAHKLDQNLSTITLRTKDAFNAKMDVVVIVHIPMNNAPQIVANFGDVTGLVSQVLQSTISSYFRNSAQNRMAIELYTNRQEIQSAAKTYISGILEKHFVECKDVLIDDVVLPDELIQPIKDREIAAQQKQTYLVQKDAQDQRKALANATALADMQKSVVQSQQEVTIAEQQAEAVKKKADGEAYRITTEGTAKATITKSIGESEAEVMDKKNKAMPNYAATVIAQTLAEHNIPIIPKIVVNSGNGSSAGNPMVDALFALELYKKTDNEDAKQTSNTAKEITTSDGQK